MDTIQLLFSSLSYELANPSMYDQQNPNILPIKQNGIIAPKYSQFHFAIFNAVYAIDSISL